jgi:hypothetical protein
MLHGLLNKLYLLIYLLCLIPILKVTNDQWLLMITD